jgi:hypothetical protein
MLVDWIRYKVKPGQTAQVLALLAEAKPVNGFFGVLHSVLGAEEQVYLLAEAADLDGEATRQQLLAADGIFAPTPHCHEVETSRFRTLDALPGLTAGDHGPIYEIRSYELQPHDALNLAEQGWAAVLDVRRGLRPITTVMHSVSGLTPRLVHIYPYASLAQRDEIRAQAISTGKWPPKGGAGRNRLMATELALAAPFSSLR